MSDQYVQNLESLQVTEIIRLLDVKSVIHLKGVPHHIKLG